VWNRIFLTATGTARPRVCIGGVVTGGLNPMGSGISYANSSGLSQRWSLDEVPTSNPPSARSHSQRWHTVAARRARAPQGMCHHSCHQVVSTVPHVLAAPSAGVSPKGSDNIIVSLARAIAWWAGLAPAGGDTVVTQNR